MQTLFIHNKPVILGTTKEKDQMAMQAKSEFSNLIIIQEPDLQEIPAQLGVLRDGGIPGFIILSDNPTQIFSAFEALFSHRQAAGGLITNLSEEILLMFRRGKWDLPKGKAEAGETPEETALREVTEETGLENIEIVKKLTETWHSYPTSVYKNKPQKENAKDILKQTFWYEMNFTGDELTVPQIEEDIVDIQWIKPENIQKYMRYSYPNLKLVFKAAGYL